MRKQMNSKSSDFNDVVPLKNSAIPLPRKTAFWAGFFYILTFVSIPTLFLYQPLHEPNYLLSNVNDNKIVMGGVCLLQGSSLSIISTFLKARPNAIAAASPE